MERSRAAIAPSARTFVVGFPGETQADFDYLAQWPDQARLDRLGAFRFEPVHGAAANDLAGAVRRKSMARCTFAMRGRCSRAISPECWSSKPTGTIYSGFQSGRRERE